MLRWFLVIAMVIAVGGTSVAQSIHPDLVLKLEISNEDAPALENLLETFAEAEGLKFFRRHTMGPLPDKRPTVRFYVVTTTDSGWHANATNLFTDDFFIPFYEVEKSSHSSELTRNLRERLERKWPGKVAPIDPRDIRLKTR